MWKILLCLSFLFYNGDAGELNIGHTPNNLRFGSGSPIHMSNVHDVLAASLGYTTQNFIWNGLTVVTPFPYPSAVVVLGIKDAGIPVKLEGVSYTLKEDTTLQDSFDHLTSLIGNEAQRPVYFKQVTADELVSDTVSSYSLPKTRYLTEEKDSHFLNEMGVLPNLADYIEPLSSVSHDGQDIIFVDIDSFEPLVVKYKNNSKKIKEASDILRSSIAQTIEGIKKLYGGEVVVVTAMVSDADKPQIRKRRATINLHDPDPTDRNIAGTYDEDYPVIFNIVLLLAVVLTVALIAISMSMAFMDPGRDSIIYRMTNPRMKKDQ